VNQRLNGGRWNLLGTHDIDGAVFVRVVSTTGSLYTVADAVAWSPVAPPPPAGSEIVIDDGQAGTAKSGTWSKSGAPNPYGTQSLYAKQAGAWYSWQRAISEPGTYDVHVWWTEWPSREPQTPYEIATVAGPVTVKRDQRTGGGRWQLLGRYEFSSSVKVTVRCPSTNTVSADAVRFVPADAPPPPPVLTDLTVTWDPPIENEDGTTCEDLAGFKILWGEDPNALGAPEDVGPAAEATIEDLAPGTYHIVATAYDVVGNESKKSTALIVTVP
jgi:hypothetical protein